MSLLEQVLAANAAVLDGSDVPVPAVPAGRRVVVVTCSEIRAPAGRDLAAYFGFAAGEAFVVANAGARVSRSEGDVARSVAEALARVGGGEVFVVAHENCDFLDADPESVAGLSAHAPSTLAAAETLCGESYVSARKLAMASAEMLRASPFVGPRVPVHAMVFDEGRRRLSAEQPGYGLTAAPGAGAAPSGLGPAPSPILGAAGPTSSGGYSSGPVSLMGAGPSALMGAPPPLVAPPPDLGAGASSFVAPPPPPMPVAPIMPPMPVPPSPPPAPTYAPAPREPAVPPPLEPISFSEPPPPPPPPRRQSPPHPQRDTPPPPPAPDDPFRRAAEVLERLRRERRK